MNTKLAIGAFLAALALAACAKQEATAPDAAPAEQSTEAPADTGMPPADASAEASGEATMDPATGDATAAGDASATAETPAEEPKQ